MGSEVLDEDTNTTPDKLKAAVKAVGVTVDKVRNHLNGK